VTDEYRLEVFRCCLDSIYAAGSFPGVFISWSAGSEELARRGEELINEFSGVGKPVAYSKMQSAHFTQYEHFQHLAKVLTLAVERKTPQPSVWVILADDDDLWHKSRFTWYGSLIVEIDHVEDMSALVIPVSYAMNLDLCRLDGATDYDVQIAKKALDKSPLLGGLEAEQKTKIAKVVDNVRFLKGDKIITRGDVGNTFYIIKDGTVECRDAKGNTFGLKTGDFFGERAMLSDEPRAADVFATSEVECLAIDRQAFNETLGSLKDVLDSNIRKKYLESVPLLKNLTDEERSKLAMKCEQREYEEGTHIITEGESGQTFFMIKSGKVAVTQRVEDEDVHRATLEAGNFFGEMALLEDDLRKATVTALSGCECLLLDRTAFNECLGNLNEIMHREARSRRRASVQDEVQKEKGTPRKPTVPTNPSGEDTAGKTVRRGEGMRSGSRGVVVEHLPEDDAGAAGDVEGIFFQCAVRLRLLNAFFEHTPSALLRNQYCNLAFLSFVRHGRGSRWGAM